jgi:hypothetical protein
MRKSFNWARRMTRQQGSEKSALRRKGSADHEPFHVLLFGGLVQDERARGATRGYCRANDAAAPRRHEHQDTFPTHPQEQTNKLLSHGTAADQLIFRIGGYGSSCMEQSKDALVKATCTGAYPDLVINECGGLLKRQMSKQETQFPTSHGVSGGPSLPSFPFRALGTSFHAF